MKRYKPTTPGSRGAVGHDFSGLTKKEPEKQLLRPILRLKGRSGGKITVRHRGGGHKRQYRLIDFKMFRFDEPAKVQAIEYDPNRTSFIALVVYGDGKKSYILAPEKLKVGDSVISSEKRIAFQAGNRMPLKYLPSGTEVFNIEMLPRGGGKLARSAGNLARVLACENGYAQVALPSGEKRMIHEDCLATIGQLSNLDHNKIVLGKAGKSRWLGRRPTVRGTAMSPGDHPHGGGEGRSLTGLRKGPKTKLGKLAYGVKTRKKRSRSNRFILERRKGRK